MTEPASSPGPRDRLPDDGAREPERRKKLFNLTVVNLALAVLAIISTAFGLSPRHSIEYGIVALGLAPAIIRYSIPPVRNSRLWEPVLYVTLLLAFPGAAFLVASRA
jgi:hypothetical protein